LAALVDARTPSIDGQAPAARLRVAIEIGNELSDAGDALVERFVSEARAAGLSWAQIGEQFGTSKQAAQKRYGTGAGREVGWPGTLAPSAHHALVRAEQEARELGCDYVGTEHLLLGLLAAEAGLAARVLTDLGVTREGVLGTSCMRASAPRRRQHDRLSVMPRLKLALEDARRIAARLGHGVPSSEHLLAGIVSVPGAMAVEILRRLGVSARDVRKALAVEFGVDAERLVVNRSRRRRLLARAS